MSCAEDILFELLHMEIVSVCDGDKNESEKSKVSWKRTATYASI